MKIEVIALRLLVAFLLGGVIGYERETKKHAAGLRTHILVSMGSALIMIISVGAFSEYSQNGDPARLASQVVSGIGFIGAGTIFKEGSTVRGLTTAASLWVSAGIGLAVGVGYYFAAIFVAALSLYSLSLLNSLEKRIPEWRRRTNKVIYLYCNDRKGLIGEIEDILAEYGLEIKKYSVTLADPTKKRDTEVRKDYTKVIRLVVPIKEELNEREVLEKILHVSGVAALFWKELQMTTQDYEIETEEDAQAMYEED